MRFSFAILTLLLAGPVPSRGSETPCVSPLEQAQADLGFRPDEIAALAEAANFLAAKADFDTLRARRIREISNPMHAPALMDHGRKTDYVVVLTHGLYDSPHSHQTLAKKFYDRGMNVLMPLLPGHWAKDPTKMDKITYRDFLREQKRAIDLAKRMGKKVILAGHSTGGLLAVDAAIKDPSIAGLVLAAPALDLTPEAAVVAKVGAFFEGTNANYFTQKAPDPYFMPYYSAHAGNEVQKLADQMRAANGLNEVPFFDHEMELAYKRRMYRRIKAPVFAMTAEKDVAIDNDEVDILMSAARGPKRQIRAEHAVHTDLGNFSPSTPGRKPGSAKSKELRGMLGELDTFMGDNFRPLEK